MKNVEIIEGVVAEYNGNYWGIQYTDGHSISKDFGDIGKAEICDSKYCTKPTDMTWDPKNTNGYNHEYELLKKAKLVNVKKTITTEFEVLQVTDVVSGSSFGELVIVQNVKNPCKLCKYNGNSSDKLPCSWCSDYIGRNGYYR